MPETDPETEYLSADDIARELGVHPYTVQRYFRDHGLPGRKIGKGWRTTRAAFNGWLTGAAVPAGELTGPEAAHFEIEDKEHPHA